jgi:hypothetical protein
MSPTGSAKLGGLLAVGTLQELLAPTTIKFYDAQWKPIGTKTELAEEIAESTNIDLKALDGAESLSYIRNASIAKRMSWASKRTTTRSEDVGYCLLGLFNVNMPLLYGEGGTKAFKRLQEEILKGTRDQSILAWSAPEGYDDPNFLANHPCCFSRSGSIEPTGEDVPAFSLNNRGLQIQLRVFPLYRSRGQYLAILACLNIAYSKVHRVGISMRGIDRSGDTLVRTHIPTSLNTSVYDADSPRTSVRERCILRTVKSFSNQLLRLDFRDDFEAYFHKQGPLYLERSNCWKVDETLWQSIRLTDRNRHSYGVVFTLQEPAVSGCAVHREADGVRKLLIRVTFRSLRHSGSMHDASVSLEEFRDTTDMQSDGLAIIPASPLSSLPASYRATLVIRSTQPNTLSASIAWERFNYQDILVLRVQMVSSWVPLRAIGHVIRTVHVLSPITERRSPFILYLALVAVATIMRYRLSSKYYVPALLLVWYLELTLWRCPGRLALRTPGTRDVLTYLCYYISLVALLQRPILVQSFILSQRLVLKESHAVFFSIVAILPSWYMSTYELTIRRGIALWLVTVVATMVPEILTAVSVRYMVFLMPRNETFSDRRQGKGYWGFHTKLLTKDPWLQ